MQAVRMAIAVAAVAVIGLAASPAAARAGYDDGDYWAFADRMEERLDPLWSERGGYYRAGGGGADPMTSSLLLLVHSVAALEGHEGPARDDERARRLAARLVEG